MNADDRAVVDAIKQSIDRVAGTVEHTKKVARELSVSLIGRSNGEMIDEGGGRIGRLERLVTWAISGMAGIIVWLLAQFVAKLIK